MTQNLAHYGWNRSLSFSQVVLTGELLTMANRISQINLDYGFENREERIDWSIGTKILAKLLGNCLVRTIQETRVFPMKSLVLRDLKFFPSIFLLLHLLVVTTRVDKYMQKISNLIAQGSMKNRVNKCLSCLQEWHWGWWRKEGWKIGREEGACNRIPHSNSHCLGCSVIELRSFQRPKPLEHLLLMIFQSS